MKIKYLLGGAVAMLLAPTAAHAEDWVLLSKSPRGCKTVTAFDEKTVICARIDNASASGNFLGFSRTTDGGDTWTDDPGPLTAPSRFRPIGWRDAMTGFVSIVSGKPTDVLYKTSDGGKTWSVKTAAKDVNSLITYAVHCAGASCYVGGRSISTTTGPGAWVAKSSDGGDSWTEVTAPPGTFAAQVWTLDAMTALVQTEKGTYRTKDGGTTWTSVAAGMDYLYGGYIKFFDGLTGYAQGSTMLLMTADGGATWTPAAFPTGAAGKPNPLLSGVDFSDKAHGLGGFGYNDTGKDGDVARTIDATVSWTHEATPAGWASAVTGVAAPSAKVGYASSNYMVSGPSVIRWGTPTAGGTDAGVDAAAPDVGPDAPAADAPASDAPAADAPASDAPAAGDAGGGGGGTDSGGGCGMARGATEPLGSGLALGLGLLAVVGARASRRGARRAMR